MTTQIRDPFYAREDFYMQIYYALGKLSGQKGEELDYGSREYTLPSEYQYLNSPKVSDDIELKYQAVKDDSKAVKQLVRNVIRRVKRNTTPMDTLDLLDVNRQFASPFVA